MKICKARDVAFLDKAIIQRLLTNRLIPSPDSSEELLEPVTKN